MTAGSRCARGHRGEEEMRVICVVYLSWSVQTPMNFYCFAFDSSWTPAALPVLTVSLVPTGQWVPSVGGMDRSSKGISFLPFLGSPDLPRPDDVRGIGSTVCTLCHRQLMLCTFHRSSLANVTLPLVPTGTWGILGSETGVVL
jgi:hypothetical protein